MNYDDLSRAALIGLLQKHEAGLTEAGRDGIVMNYSGRTAPWQITRQVKPKITRINKRLSEGEEQFQAQNVIMEGENLSAMVTLYKYRGQVDLILTDPPYNTGEDFRYNDKWDEDPNDPDLGDIVPKEDGSRHSKWLRFMTPRVWMMKEMLRPLGVIAICIDERELFRLGMLMDEIFREENRIAIINWQKAYAPKSDTGGRRGGVSSATEYVLVYAKDLDKARTGLLPRTESMDSKYKNPDNDPEGDWRNDNLSAQGSDTHPGMVYAIQNPFSGELFYPPQGRHWGNDKKYMKQWLEGWGSNYVEMHVGDNQKALVLKGYKRSVNSNGVITAAKKKAQKIQEMGPWPRLYFGLKGDSGPQIKRYMEHVKKGRVPLTYWADEDYEIPFELGNQSWDHEQSGHSQTGVKELDVVVGKGHNFKTVKPLRLFKKIIQIWCSPDGTVMDPFAGSGTTAHAVLEMNKEAKTSRRFVLIEQGNDKKGDHYAKTLTADRIRRVVKGNWKSGKHEPLGGGFRFIEMKRQQVDAGAVNALQREEMIDLLLTSYWDKSEKAKSYLSRFPAGVHRYLFGINPKNEGFFLVWDSADGPSVLDRKTFKAIAEEAKENNLVGKYHVYASLAPYTGRTVEFYKIPDRVLEHIGFNARADAYNNETTEPAK